MAYKARPGIVLTNICDVPLLIPTRAASESCPHVMRLNLLSTIVWKTFEQDMPMENAVRAFQIFLKTSDEEVKARIQKITDDLYEKGFLIEVPYEDEAHDAD